MIEREDGSLQFQHSLRHLAVVGFTAAAVFAGTMGVWAWTAPLNGAVISTGQFVVEGNIKKVQHQTGGTVSELRVQEGDRVTRGQIVIRLDDTIPRANLQIIAKQLDEFAARRSRLEAERDAKDRIEIPPEFTQRFHEAPVTELVRAEAGFFEARRTAREGQKAQLAKRISQLADEIAGLRSQQVARYRQSELIEEELIAVKDLHSKNLVSLARKTALEREAASIAGMKGQLVAAIAQTQGKISEIELQIIQIGANFREEVIKELREIQARSAELVERRVAAEDQLRRVDIRSPSEGYVYQLATHTVGGVITSAEPAMYIVPAEDSLQLDVRINPPDIDQIALGRPALIKLHAFNQRTTPELNGTVTRISPDSARDPQTGAFFYAIRISVDPTEFARLLPQIVVAGMQADVFVQTVQRTPFEFIVKPLKDQVSKAFKER